LWMGQCVGFLVVLFLSFASCSQFLQSKVWKGNDDASKIGSYKFPEETEIGSWLERRTNTGISFSGGGSRAYLAATGSLRGFKDLGLLSKIRYLTGVSGGTWATTVFSYYQSGASSDEQILGDIVAPEDIVYDDLLKMDPRCMRLSTNSSALAELAKLLTNTSSVDWNEVWIKGISDIFLKPFGISGDQYFSWDSDTVADIISRNSFLTKDRFILPSSNDHPFPIWAFSILTLKDMLPIAAAYPENFFLMETTPLYTGSLNIHEVTFHKACFLCTNSTTLLTGGFVENVAFLEEAPSDGIPTDGITVKVPFANLNYSVKNIAGVSSFAPGDVLAHLGSVTDYLGIVFNYWTPFQSSPPTYSVVAGDGGIVENVHLIGLIQRGVQNIVLFINSETPLKSRKDWDPTKTDPSFSDMDDVIPGYFGFTFSEAFGYNYDNNQIFDKKYFGDVAAKLQDAQAVGKGTIAVTEQETIENTWYGIPAGIKVNITWMYLGRTFQWEQALSAEMKALVIPEENPDDPTSLRKTGPFIGFPNIPTFSLRVAPDLANLLSDLTGWIITQNFDLFSSFLS